MPGSLYEWTTGRFLATLFGAAVVAVIAGVFLGRATAPDHGGGSRPASPPPATSTSTPPPAGGASAPPVAAGANLPGAPTKMNSLGIPVGYPHTEAGAISACGNYVSAYGDVRNRTPERTRAVFRTISLPAIADKLAARISTIDKKNAQNYGVPSVVNPSVNFDIRVAGYQVQSYNTNSATVLVWSAASFGVYGSTDDLAPQERWGTDRCSVTWSSGDWRISNSGDGPEGPNISERAADSYERFTYVGGPE